MNGKGREYSFRIDFTSEDGQEFQGQFTAKRQSIMDQARINRRQAELSGAMYCVKDSDGNPTGQGIDEFTEKFNYALALLETVIIAAPPWWDLETVDDIELVFQVFQEVQKNEDSFRGRGRKENQEAGSNRGSEGDSQGKSQNTDSGDGGPKVVDKEVSASLDA